MVNGKEKKGRNIERFTLQVKHNVTVKIPKGSLGTYKTQTTISTLWGR